MPQCPYCHKEIVVIDYWQKGQIEYGGNIKSDGWWPMQDIERILQCPECLVPFDAEDLDKLGVPEDLR